MDKKTIIGNRRSRERLTSLVKNISAKELKMPLYPEGWTVAVALGHIAFWDSRRLELIKTWKKSGVQSFPMSSEIVNNTLVPILLLIPPKKITALAISVAEELDNEIENLSPEFVKEVEKLGENNPFDRANHRNMHLDDIEKALQNRK